jgi:hypothetical protein
LLTVTANFFRTQIEPSNPLLPALNQTPTESSSNTCLDGQGSARLRWLIRSVTVAVSLFYLSFLAMWVLARDVVISAVASLQIWDVERVTAKAGNILFGMTYIYIVFITSIGFAAVLERLSGTSPVSGLIQAKPLAAEDTRWWVALCRILTLLGFVLVPLYFVHARVGMDWLFLEDGPMEYFTAAGFAVSGLVLLYAGRLQLKARPKDRILNLIAWGLLIAGLASILVCLEEISWGQRIFGIETPEVLSEINTQDELNLHNLFTNYFNESYFFIGIVFLVLSLSLFFLRERYGEYEWSQWLPHPYLLTLVVLVASFSFHIESNELVEPLAVLYLIGYAAQILSVSRKRRADEAAPRELAAADATSGKG